MKFIDSTDSPNIFMPVPESTDDMISLGALCSKYSRSSKSMKTVWKEEFENNPDRGTEFYERVLIGYGDDSVADMVGGGITICFEDIPIMWSTQLLTHRLIGAIEKSTRYVPLNEDSYYRMNPQTDHWSSQAMKNFTKEFEKRQKLLTERYGESNDKPVKNAIRSEALDRSRHLLPMTALTSLAITANIRQWIYMINERSKTVPVMLDVKDILDRHFSVFTKRIKIKESSDQTIQFYPYATETMKNKNSVELIKYSSGYAPNRPITQTAKPRLTRRDKIPRDFESYTFTFGIMTNIGIYREFHRHRFLSIYESRFYGKGPQPLLGDPAMFICHTNIRELVHLIELRSGEQTHKDFRDLIFQMVSIIKKQLNLSDERILFKFINNEKLEGILGRLNAEKKIEAKGINDDGL